MSSRDYNSRDRYRDDRRRDDRRRDDRHRDDRHRDDRHRSDRPRDDRREGGDNRYGDRSSSSRYGYNSQQPQPAAEQPAPTEAWDAAKEAEKDPNWARIYVSNLPADVTSDELQELFGGLGIIAKEKQKRGYKDQWPYKIKLYTGDDGKAKGDATITYEDPNAARSAPSFFNGHEIRGKTIKVELAGKPEPPKGGWQDSRGGRGGRGGGRRGGGGRGRYRPY